MNGRTTAVLLALIALLASAIWFQRSAEEDAFLVDRPLFEGLDARQVQTIRIDNIERGLNLRLEHDSAGMWYLTDPLNYPADYALVQLLLEDVARARAMPVPQNERGEQELGFDPPKIVLQVEGLDAEGSPRSVMLEIGARDLDGMRLNVRVDGVYLRCLVRLYTTLNRDVDDFRSRYPLTLGVDQIVELEREGQVVYEEGQTSFDVQLAAIRDGTSWFAIAPDRALLDSLDIGVLIVGAARLPIESFLEDEVRDLRPYGLEKPVGRLEFKTVAGDSEVLLVGHPEHSSRWFLAREGAPFVWGISHESAMRLMLPFEGLVDLHFMRVLREGVSALFLRTGERTLRLRRESQGWSVASRLGEGAWSEPLLADEAQVEDVLARLEGLEFELREEQRDGPFEASGAVLIDGSAGRMGGSFATRADGSGVDFQRTGDSIILRAPDWLGELAARSAADFRSSQLTRLSEHDLQALRLTQGSRRVEFTRDGHGLWHRAGSATEALALLPLLDAMIYLRADSFVDEPLELQAKIGVEFVPFEGSSTRFEVFRDSEGASLAEVGGSQSRLRVRDLHASLLALLEP